MLMFRTQYQWASEVGAGWRHAPPLRALRPTQPGLGAHAAVARVHAGAERQDQLATTSSRAAAAAGVGPGAWSTTGTGADIVLQDPSQVMCSAPSSGQHQQRSQHRSGGDGSTSSSTSAHTKATRRGGSSRTNERGSPRPARPLAAVAAALFAVGLLLATPLAPPPAHALVPAQQQEEEETLSNVPGQLGSSAGDETQRQPLSRLMAGANKRGIESCTRKCVPTCVRGGEGGSFCCRAAEAARRWMPLARKGLRPWEALGGSGPRFAGECLGCFERQRHHATAPDSCCPPLQVHLAWALSACAASPAASCSRSPTAHALTA
jgi:hypothetical protein